MTANPISAELAASRAEVANLRAEMERVAKALSVAEARLDAFEIAYAAFENAAPKSKPSSAKRKRNRLPNEQWQGVFREIYEALDNEFGYDDIVDTAVQHGMDVKRASLRTKMMNYADGGYVERKDAGRFAITPKGIPYFKIEARASKENEPHSENAGGSDAGWGGAATPARPWNQPSDQTADW
ncbi:hypothetical protein U8326_06450 [Tsuneonella sp. CC-YZS046]|uniref:hypothetical protein n=1 Tax=Tsuneonella sp. CC-YZS046 TaxID=3042152 RepID=UPI002D79A1B4|nr:hypothetical protein [Tsuneonella sp. CC-YZS046]WRO67792.1 hypothetical protein U8326_06450 [Tsuneonella sp. CC-YZS046]